MKQFAEHGSDPRSPDQALVFHGWPDTGSPEERNGKPISSYGEAIKTKETGGVDCDDFMVI